MARPLLIGIKGKIGAGKTTSANILTRDMAFTEYAMADPIKQIALVFGFTRRELYGTQEDKNTPNALWGLSARQFLQRFGTDICNTQFPIHLPEMSNVWIRLFEAFLERTTCLKIIVSDVRFVAEADMIRKHKGIIIEVTNRERACSSTTVTNHQSETEQDLIKADHIIQNEGTVEELESMIRTIVETYEN